ncbi:MAG TPA: motility protein A [bacterium]|nr:motility protein A [bacterium]
MSTFFGIIVGMGLLLVAIILQGGIGIFFNLEAIMIVFGGTIAATFISYPLPRVLKVMGISLNIFRRDFQEPSGHIQRIVQLAHTARKNSVLSLEGEGRKIKNRILKLGVEMLVDGHPPEFIREVLETELDFLQVRHRSGEQVFRSAAKFAPAFGLIGTLIGLIAMMRNLGGSDANASIGKGMAVALVGTFYGAMLANLFLLPVSEKLKSRTEEEVLRGRIIIEGVLLIQAGVNPRIVEKKLNAFLPPEMRTSYSKRLARSAQTSKGGETREREAEKVAAS